MQMCEPREGVTAFVEHEHWHEGGRLHEEYEWKVIGVGALQKGIALTFEGAAEAARRVVDDD